MSDINRNYITSCLFYKDNKLYNESDDGKIIKINAKNWHKYLLDYGWTKLDWGWKRRLKHLDKNFRYGLLDCGSNGDCLFHVIAEGLNNIKTGECNYDVQTLRNLAAEQITVDNYEIILESYRLEEEDGEFLGDWNPQSIRNKEDLRLELCKSGDNFWGDHIVLQLLQNILKINIIILNSCDNEHKYKIHPTATDLNIYEKTIILYYLDGLHFQLVGYYNKNEMKTCFKRNEIPNELLYIYQTDCHKN